jgi:Mn2+/Fe2+ NRAMP family transporter
LNLPFSQGKSFYLVLLLEAAAAAGLVLIPGIPLVYIVLLVNVIAVLAMPPALLFLYMLVNDREIMGDLVSPRWANMLALAVVVILIGAGLMYGISVISPNALAMIGAK